MSRSEFFPGSLLQKLADHRDSSVCPLHMPGHKRSPQLPAALPYGLDVTEITDFDSLHEAEGILRDGMLRTAQLFGADHSFWLVNGSSCGILAGICAAAKPGDTVLLARGCHKSVYHALELRGLTPVYLLPAQDAEWGVAASMPPAAVQAALDANPAAALVVLTSPTYEGVVSDIAAIAAVCHARGVPLLVDEAHGAHLPLWPAMRRFGAIAAGADIVIQSLHKTLPSFTQTALAHVNGSLVSAEEMRRQLAVFQSSSPSYLLMGGIDHCVRLLETDGPALFAAYEARLARFSRRAAGWQNVRVLCHGADSAQNHPGFFAFDTGKLVLAAAGMTGTRLKDTLRTRFGLELEMAAGGYALAMTSICDSDETFARLADALQTLDGELSPAPARENAQAPFFLPPMHLAPAAARAVPFGLCPLAGAAGRVAAESVWAYPPGIPLVVPGEEITPAFLALLAEMEAQGVAVHSESGAAPGAIRVLEETRQAP